MNHIFISYSRKNEIIVDTFAQQLRDAGYSIWQDKSGAGMGIPFSTKWFTMIEEALYLSSAAIIFNSEYWEKSVNCANEFALIEKCAIPYLELNPYEVELDPVAAMEQVKQFYRNRVNIEENSNRTQLFSAAYEWKTGVNPYQLIQHTKGFKDTIIYLLGELNNLEKQMKSKNYEKLAPDMYPYMEKYIKFTRRSKIRRIVERAAGFLMAAVALSIVLAGVIAIKPSMERNENVYNGEAVSGEIAELWNIDPVLAIYKAANMNRDYLQITSFYMLCMNVARLKNVNLPVSIVEEGSGLQANMMVTDPITVSGLYCAEPQSDSGSILITRLSDNSFWTVNSPGKVSCFAWSSDGKCLAFATGSRVYVYDPSGYGTPVSLAENYEEVKKLSFVEKDGQECIVAFTERGTAIVWNNPLQHGSVNRQGINYGVFLKNQKGPAVVFLDGNNIVINRNGLAQIISIPVEGVFNTTSLTVSDDGNRIAAIYNIDGIYRVICMDLLSGEVLLDVKSDYRLTGLVFDENESSLYASAYGCTAAMIDLNSGDIKYGDQSLYFGNIVRWRQNFIISDYNGKYTIIDKDLSILRDFERTNLAYMPCFTMVIASEKGYMFTVNRGGGGSGFSERINLNKESMNVFFVPMNDRVDSNTAVALSDDEEYVAFGYPDGMIRIYETEHMYLVAELQNQGNSVSALHFSADGSTIYALSETGDIHALNLPHYELNNNIEAMEANWQTMISELIEKYNQYKNALYSNESAY